MIFCHLGGAFFRQSHFLLASRSGRKRENARLFSRAKYLLTGLRYRHPASPALGDGYADPPGRASTRTANRAGDRLEAAHRLWSSSCSKSATTGALIRQHRRVNRTARKPKGRGSPPQGIEPGRPLCRAARIPILGVSADALVTVFYLSF